MTASDIVRQKIISDIVNKMTEEDKRDYLLLTNNSDIRQTLALQDEKLNQLLTQNTWAKNFWSDVAANAITYSAFLLLGKLWK